MCFALPSFWRIGAITNLSKVRAAVLVWIIAFSSSFLFGSFDKVLRNSMMALWMGSAAPRSNHWGAPVE